MISRTVHTIGQWVSVLEHNTSVDKVQRDVELGGDVIFEVERTTSNIREKLICVFPALIGTLPDHVQRIIEDEVDWSEATMLERMYRRCVEYVIRLVPAAASDVQNGLDRLRGVYAHTENEPNEKTKDRLRYEAALCFQEDCEEACEEKGRTLLLIEELIRLAYSAATAEIFREHERNERVGHHRAFTEMMEMELSITQSEN